MLVLLELGVNFTAAFAENRIKLVGNLAGDGGVIAVFKPELEELLRLGGSAVALKSLLHE